MDEYNQGMDPAVRRYFKQIIRSFIAGLVWMILMVITGIYLKAGVIEDGLKWYNIVFYVFFLASLLWLIRFFYRCWK